MTSSGTDERGIRASHYAGCLYCPGCNTHYRPFMTWGLVLRSCGTTGLQLTGLHRKGDECPRCGDRP